MALDRTGGRRAAGRSARGRRRGRASTSEWTGWTMSGGAGLRDMWTETAELDDDKFHDECGLFGVWNHAEAANVAYLGLYSLQHRGQESAGIAATDGQSFHVEKAMGWVADVFSRDRLKRLPGHRAIGHVRYSTAGSSNLRNAQPISAQTAHGPVAHRRTTATSSTPRSCGASLEQDGAVFQSIVRHRGDHPPPRPRRGRHPRGPAPARARPGEGRLHPAAPHPRLHGGRARSLGLPAALAGPPRRRLGPRLRDLRARPPRGGVRARHRARRDGRRSTTAG